MGSIVKSCMGEETSIIDFSPALSPTAIGEVRQEVSAFSAQNRQAIEPCYTSTIDNLQLPYYSCVGLIQFKMQGNTNLTPFATGALIMDDLVLTAAHSFFYRQHIEKICISCQPTSFWIQFYDRQERVEYQVDKWRVNQVFETMIKQCQKDRYFQYEKMLSKNMIGFDFALIKLKRPIRNVNFPKLLQNHHINDLPHSSTTIIHGYSVKNISYGQGSIKTAEMTKNCGGILKIIDNHFQHDLQTTYGHSGSPVFRWTKSLGGVENYYIVGVHTGNYDLGAIKYGALVTETMVERLKSWEQELHENKVNNNFNIFEIKQNIAQQLQSYQIKKRTKPKKQYKPIQSVEDSTISLEGYQTFRFQFNTELNQSQYYEVTNSKECKTVRRIRNQSIFENQPYHFTSKQSLPSQKWKISIRISKYSQGEVIVLGFINEFLRIEQQSSGFLKQPQCVSLCACEKSKEMNKTGSILIDGDLWIQSNQIFLERGDILTIYGDIPSRKLYWRFPSGPLLQSRIPQSIFANNAKMHFFVGLNNTEQNIDIMNE